MHEPAQGFQSDPSVLAHILPGGSEKYFSSKSAWNERGGMNGFCGRITLWQSFYFYFPVDAVIREVDKYPGR